MKRTTALILTLVLLLAAFSGCTKKEIEGSTEPEQTVDYEALYAPLIEKYRDAFANPDAEDYDLDMDRMAIIYYGDTAGYAFYDINQDGTPELIIGSQDDNDGEQIRPNVLGGIYTLRNDKPKWLIGSYDEYTSVSVLEDGRIVEASNYLGQLGEGTIISVCKIKNGNLPVMESYFGVDEYDEATDSYSYVQCYSVDGTLPLDSDGEVLIDQMQPVSPQAYEEIMASLADATMSFPITLFAAETLD